ncbi:response regulator transcription factor [Sulfuricystis multivorans]|uniref:response regulator transcription factor n=1 Tax=Sulfuricystis multivorans TaxID=2211108 RepID=UPI0024DFD062|nr:response regulator [Sulfuricystis multivorans]
MPDDMTSGMAYLVDDDAAIRDALPWLLRSRGIACRAWASAEAFLADYRDEMSGCLILDLRMAGMTGSELFERLLERGCAMPVIFLTGHGDVPLAVNALKRGAFDFIEKPFNDNELADRVHEALQYEKNRRRQDGMKAAVLERLATLTERERQVMEHILAGKLNKVIADELSIAMRTVEVHRAHIFEKMGVRSAVELAQRLSLLGPPGSR